MHTVTVFFLFCAEIITETNGLRDLISEYYSHSNITNFRSIWNQFKRPIDEALEKAIENSVGFTGMNVLIRYPEDKTNLAPGYWHTDNQVHLVLQNLALDDVPRLRLPEVSLDLADNVVQLETRLSKMIVTADYLVARKKSDIIYDVDKQNPSKKSPFLFQQVPTKGKVAITLDSCMLTGHAIAKLGGKSVNIGYYRLRLSECQYLLEIYKPGSGMPPVMASYYPIRGGLTLEHLLLKPVYDEVIVKLQSAILSVINTTAIFDTQLSDFQANQNTVFQNVSVFMISLARNLNKALRDKTNGFIDMGSFPQLVWDKAVFHMDYGNETAEPLFNSMVINGLDTAYCPLIGGPFNINKTLIGDQIRFNSMQVRGNYDGRVFGVEIRDVAVDIEINAKKPMNISSIEVISFRTTELSIGGAEKGVSVELEALITGYIRNTVPDLIVSSITTALKDALCTTLKDDKKPETLSGQYSGLFYGYPGVITIRVPLNDTQE